MTLLDPINYVQGTINHAFESHLPVHIQEQVELRKFLCGECLKAGQCEVCKCKTPQMFYSPHKEDSKGRWGTFMNEGQWKALKENMAAYAEFIQTLKEREQYKEAAKFENTQYTR